LSPGPIRVSAVMPSYNRDRYVAEALESALSQGFEGLEVVVVDDGSTDGSRAVLEGFGDRIRTEFRANAGQSATVNRAVEMARGEYVALIDNDDAWLPGKLARQIPLLDAEPRAAILYAAFEVMDGEGKTIPDPRPSRRTPSGEVLGDLFDENFLRTPTVIFRRALFLEAGGYDPSLRYTNDWDMWLRIATGRLVLRDPTVSARYRLHGSQLVKNRLPLAEERVRVLEHHLPRVEREAPALAGRARAALARRCLKLARLRLRDGKGDEAGRLADRALGLAPGLRLSWWRMRATAALSRSGPSTRP
jgi:glycosyltransferase involved in cell wall biosynthesis